MKMFIATKWRPPEKERERFWGKRNEVPGYWMAFLKYDSGGLLSWHGRGNTENEAINNAILFAKRNMEERKIIEVEV